MSLAWNSVDPRARLIWLAASLATLFVLDDVVADVVVIAALAAVAATGEDDGRAFGTALKLGVVILVARTVLAALTGHSGPTVLFHLPQLDVFGLLTIGGAVSAEVVTSSATEGLRLVAVLCCFGAFSSVASAVQVLRLIPRSLYEAGLIVSIAVTFVPQIGRTFREIREAQMMRGGRRDVVAVVVPVLMTAMERSISLAESMDSRGYGRTIEHPGANRLRLMVLCLSASAFASATLWLMGIDSAVPTVVTVLSLAGAFVAFKKLSSMTTRTVYSRLRWNSFSTIQALFAASGLALAAMAPQTTLDPYAGSWLPSPGAITLLSACFVAVPAVLQQGKRSSG